ncbi:hypothetical protein HK104_007341 [Borealophlyctis nickersoniae]|nr:hypothetical protein HK104_007341 [Borealophlyctis nickersoniae]
MPHAAITALLLGAVAISALPSPSIPSPPERGHVAIVTDNNYGNTSVSSSLVITTKTKPVNPLLICAQFGEKVITHGTGTRIPAPDDVERQVECTNSAGLISRPNTKVLVNTAKAGPVIGTRNALSWRFLSIPYAEPPTGDLRFAAPVPKAAFTTPYEALSSRRHCPQSNNRTAGEGARDIENEDCLHLNIYTPVVGNTSSLPVLLWIHGGSFINGGIDDLPYDGGMLASRNKAVIVTINYRLGILGFFEDTATYPRSLVPGNQAIRDQTLALRWVQNNIASFGGNPAKVMVFGESAGGFSVRTLLASPPASGLFSSATIHSDPINTPFRNANVSSATIAPNFMKLANCTDLACLRALPVETVLEVQDQLAPIIEKPCRALWLVDAGRLNKVPVNFLFLNNEAGLYTPFALPTPLNGTQILQAARAMLRVSVADTQKILSAPEFGFNPNGTDERLAWSLLNTYFTYGCPARYFAKRMVERGARVRVGRFDKGYRLLSSGAANGGFCNDTLACHSDDIIPTFATSYLLGRPLPPSTLLLSRDIGDRWTALAATGVPDVDGRPPWPVFADGSGLVFKPEGVVEGAWMKGQCDEMDRVGVYAFLKVWVGGVFGGR